VLDSSQTEKTKMDFFTMERKNLQTLCKKHGIPANLKKYRNGSETFIDL
jgi:hypothetical protein